MALRYLIRPLRFALLVLSVAMVLSETVAQEAGLRREEKAINGKGNVSTNSGVLPNVDSVLDYFESIVFESEYAITRGEPVLAKWQRPLRIALRGTVSSLNRRTTEQHVRTLAEITGLDMQTLSLPWERVAI